MQVTYIDHMGTDKTPTNAARISFNKDNDNALDVRDLTLLTYLADNDHMSPFEHNTLTVEIKVPLYIAKQIMRHRTFAFNEVSRRYTSDDLEFYVPTKLSKQAKTNRQASQGHLSPVMNRCYQRAIKKLITESEVLYENLLGVGVSREQARAVLPQCLYTRFIMTGNLRNWVHFIKLRRHKSAQKEVQIVADAVLDILKEYFPHSTAALVKKK